MLNAFFSCSSYSELVIEYRVGIPKESGFYYKDNNDEEKVTGSKNNTGKNLIAASTKYFVRGKGLNPESKIMNKAVEEALNGHYLEAEILFNELKGLLHDGSVENNLGVVFEAEKRNKEAMNMYINALIKSPENSRFRSNLLSFICHNKYRKEN